MRFITIGYGLASTAPPNLLNRSRAVEPAPRKIRVNCIAPAMGATGPLGRLSEPKDIANDGGARRRMGARASQ